MHLLRCLFSVLVALVVFATLSLPAQASCTAGTICNVQTWSQQGRDIDFMISDGSRVRLSVLDTDTIQVRFAPAGVFSQPISRAVVNRNWAQVTPFATELGDQVVILTGGARVEVRKTPFVLDVRTPGGELIVGDDAARRMQWTATRTRVYKRTQPGEAYLGLGWRTLGLRRNGTRFAIRNVPNYGTNEAFYGSVPFWYGWRAGKVYGIYFDEPAWGQINVGQESAEYMYFENLGGQVDYYVFTGPSMAVVLDRYTALTGRPFMPPKWSLGYQQCRWSYVPQAKVLEIANGFRSRNIPCDVIYLDIDYMPGGRALTFDSAKFPNPAGMINTLHNQGFRVVANISPFLFHHDPRYATALNNGYFLKQANGQVHNGWHDYWYFVGGAATGSLSWIDFTKTSARTWWKAQHSGFLGHGIDGIWNDLNEPEELAGAGGWPQNVKYDFDGAPVNHNQTGTQYCLLQTESTYETLLAQRPNERPFVLSRGSFAGMQRSAATWSGDNVANWINDFQRNTPMGLSLSICGQPFNGHDIGGFFGFPTYNTKTPPELFARWMQAGVFYPLCRAHHDGFGADPQRPYVEPWEFGPQVEAICCDYIGLRYRLMPYLYSLFYQAHVSGAPVQRPTVYDFPADQSTLSQDHDFMFGPWLLISPVTQAGATVRSVYLPKVAQWYDWWTGQKRSGGLSANVGVTLERMPIHVLAGAILPMGPVMQHTDQVPLTALTVEVWPAEQETSFALYEDDGISFAYRQGVYALTTLRQRREGDGWTFTIAARQGNYQPPARTLTIKVHAWDAPVDRVTLNGAPLQPAATLAALLNASSGYHHEQSAERVWLRVGDSGQGQTVQINGDLAPAAVSVY